MVVDLEVVVVAFEIFGSLRAVVVGESWCRRSRQTPNQLDRRKIDAVLRNDVPRKRGAQCRIRIGRGIVDRDAGRAEVSPPEGIGGQAELPNGRDLLALASLGVGKEEQPVLQNRSADVSAVLRQ